MATNPYNLRHNIQYAINIHGIGKMLCKLKCYDIDYERQNGYYILIVLHDIIINGIKEPEDFHIFPHVYPIIFYDIVLIKEHAKLARESFEKRSLNIILKKLINENFEWL